MQKIIFLLVLNKFKNTESAQLCQIIFKNPALAPQVIYLLQLWRRQKPGQDTPGAMAQALRYCIEVDHLFKIYTIIYTI